MDPVVHVHRVIEVDAGQYSEDERLQERDHELESQRIVNSSGAKPKILLTTKPAKTFSIVWLTIMLAKRRTERLIE